MHTAHQCLLGAPIAALSPLRCVHVPRKGAVAPSREASPAPWRCQKAYSHTRQCPRLSAAFTEAEVCSVTCSRLREAKPIMCTPDPLCWSMFPQHASRPLDPVQRTTPVQSLFLVCAPAVALMGIPMQVRTSPPAELLAESAPSPRLGVTLEEQGASFRVWAPHAQSAHLELKDGTVLPLVREGDTWAAAFAPGTRSCHGPESSGI